MAYDHTFLFDAVRQSLNRTPFSSLRGLAQELRVSEGTLEKAVNDATGKTFRDFKDEIVMDRLMEFFASHRTCTIKQASLAVGYKSQRSFARAVKRACGLSPQALRSRMVFRQG